MDIQDICKNNSEALLEYLIKNGYVNKTANSITIVFEERVGNNPQNVYVTYTNNTMVQNGELLINIGQIFKDADIEMSEIIPPNVSVN